MNSSAPDVAHVLSGRNLALLNVVVQYADMDTLRALALISQSMYETLKRCHFNHLTVVVLEAPLLDLHQQVVYNGADPVPTDTFQLHRDDMVATPLVQMPSPTPPPSQRRDRDSALLDGHAFDAWLQLSIFRNDYIHNLAIPDYARNFMARAQSVELAVYRRRLGTRLTAFFTNNAHRLKHGLAADIDECTLCAESKCHKQPRNENAQYELHLDYPPTPHDHQYNPHDVKHTHDSATPPSDDGCIFSKHYSREISEGDAAESRRLRFQTMPQLAARNNLVDYERVPSLQLKIPHNITDIGLENGVTPCNTAASKDSTKRKRYTRHISYRDGHLSIIADYGNTRVYHPRFQNLPLAEQQAPTTALKIRMVDCLSFGVEDWRNAIPGCRVQPVQTWVIHDDAWVPQHPLYPAKLSGCDENENINDGGIIARHFPLLTNLVLQHTRLNKTNRCGIGELIISRYNNDKLYTPLSHFFINDDVHLPHLQHFGVVGALLDPTEYASLAIRNERITSLNINPGLLLRTDTAHIIGWLTRLNDAFDGMEHQEEEEEDGGRLHAGQGPVPRHHKLRPHRKYNFSFDFASSYLESCCPQIMHTLAPNGDFSQSGQHRITCDPIHDALFDFYSAHTNNSGNIYCVSLPGSPPLQLLLPNDRPRLVVAIDIAKLAQRTLTYLELRCHYCSHANPGCTMFPGASPGDCTATHLPPPANAPLGIDNLPQDEGQNVRPRLRGTQYNLEMYMRLRQLLHIPPHVVLRL